MKRKRKTLNHTNLFSKFSRQLKPLLSIHSFLVLLYYALLSLLSFFDQGMQIYYFLSVPAVL